MPVNSHHPDFDAALPVWQRARDVLAGEDAVKAASERYLPRLESQSDPEYAAYKARAAFFNATARTADGFVGMIFRRQPTLKRPAEGAVAGKAVAAFVADVDLQSTALEAYAETVVQEVVAVGRAGTLVDWGGCATGQLGGSSRAGRGGEERAYAVLYAAEQILNWASERVDGRLVLSRVVLRENAEGGMKNEDGDEFERETVEQIRVLKLERVEGQPRCVVEIWREEGADGAAKRSGRAKRRWTLVETRVPLRLGKPLPRLPFVFHGPRHSQPGIAKLPLADIIAVNLDHYRLNADYKHGLHFTALPTAWVSGFEKDSNLRIGSSTAWVTETVGASAGFLEFTGQGLTTFERAMDRDERLMALLGTRMLEAQKRVGESADAIELRQSGEDSVLSAVALSVSESLTQVLRWVYWWNATEATPEDVGPDVVLLQLNTDFSNKGMASDELTAIVAAWQAGAISRATMFDLFRRGEVLPAGRTDEEERRLVAARGKGEDGGLRMEDGRGERVKG